MRLMIAAVGRLKDGPERQLYARYADRIAAQGRALAFGPLDLAELPESRASDVASRMTDEGQRLLARSTDANLRIALDETGKALSSREVAQLLLDARDDGVASVAFLIGGPDGHAPEVRQAAGRCISLGRITLPHGLARVVLAEQIYRAITIIAGHPYHRD